MRSDNIATLERIAERASVRFSEVALTYIDAKFALHESGRYYWHSEVLSEQSYDAVRAAYGLLDDSSDYEVRDLL